MNFGSLPLLILSVVFTFSDPGELPDSSSLPPLEREPRKIKNKATGDWGSLTSQTTHADWRETLLWEDPLRKREWRTDESWRYEVMGPFFLFGNVGAKSEEAVQEMKVSGKTGVACKLPLVWDAELIVRGGPSVTYTDPLRRERMKERSEWLVEVQARWPLLAGIGLEYEAVAAPALTPVDKNWIDQDLRLAFPVGGAGKVRVGARQRWETTVETRPWSEGMELYLGLEWSR